MNNLKSILRGILPQKKIKEVVKNLDEKYSSGGDGDGTIRDGALLIHNMYKESHTNKTSFDLAKILKISEQQLKDLCAGKYKYIGIDSGGGNIDYYPLGCAHVNLSGPAPHNITIVEYYMYPFIIGGTLGSIYRYRFSVQGYYDDDESTWRYNATNEDMKFIT